MTQAGVWWAASIAAAIAIGASVTEWRQSKRRDLDRVGVVPWGTVSMLGFVGAVVGLAVALKG